MSLKIKKERAIQLRKAGHSYGYIMKKLNIGSKGTVSSWLSGLKLSKDVEEKIINDGKTSIRKGFHIYNDNRRKNIEKENSEYFSKGKSLTVIKCKQDLLLVGAALYWGEGTKYEGKYPALIFTNSDPKMISLYMRFLREGICIDESLIKAGIHLHPNVDELEARKFWSQVTKIPSSSFYVVNVKNIASRGKREPKKLPHGMVVIKVNRRRFFYLMKGMIESLV